MPLSRVQPTQYEDLLGQKSQKVTELLAPFSPPTAQIIASSPTGYRLRAEFRMWHEGEDINYVMFHPERPKTPVIIKDFPVADDRIQAVMPALRDALKVNHTLRHKLFQVEFLATLSGDMLITLVYHRKLDEAWELEVQTLRRDLKNDFPSISFIGPSRKQKLVIHEDFVQEILPVHGREYTYRQYEQAFTQPNARVNIRMIEWACDQASSLTGDLLELYCGNGNFTLPLSQYFDNVVATELSKPSIRAARFNIEENNIDNVELVRLSAEEVTQAIHQVRQFRRLSELQKPFDQYQFETVFVDPPRAGLDSQTLDMVCQFQNILYISCNPQTLADNLLSLCKSHQVAQFALFDQFPYTDHMECGVLLQKR